MAHLVLACVDLILSSLFAVTFWILKSSIFKTVAAAALMAVAKTLVAPSKESQNHETLRWIFILIIAERVVAELGFTSGICACVIASLVEIRLPERVALILEKGLKL